jgi:hypothetical protein
MLGLPLILACWLCTHVTELVGIKDTRDELIKVDLAVGALPPPSRTGGLLVGVCLRWPGEACAGRGTGSRRAWT